MDKRPDWFDNSAMQPTVEQVVAQYRELSDKQRRKYRTATAARDFLIRAGIAERSSSSPNGIRLAKRFR